MLILSRKPKEAILIGDDIKIIVCSASGSNIRLGINAPKEISVYREEIYKKIQEQKNISAEPSDETDAA